VALSRIDKEVHGLIGAVLAFSFFHFRPEFLIFGRAVAGIHFQPTGIDTRDEVETDFGFGLRGEGKRSNSAAERLLQKRGDRLADAGGIDNGMLTAARYFLIHRPFFHRAPCVWRQSSGNVRRFLRRAVSESR
jgi:hypothetical protein